MHAAPPVRVSLGRSLGWVVFCAIATSIAFANAAAWLLLSLEREAAPAALLGAAAGAAALWQAWRGQSPGDLNWDGTRWQWAGVDGCARAMVDLGAWMLLRFDPAAGRHRWIAASRGSATGSWPALRAALYSPRPADPLDPEQP